MSLFHFCQIKLARALWWQDDCRMRTKLHVFRVRSQIRLPPDDYYEEAVTHTAYTHSPTAASCPGRDWRHARQPIHRTPTSRTWSTSRLRAGAVLKYRAAPPPRHHFCGNAALRRSRHIPARSFYISTETWKVRQPHPALKREYSRVSTPQKRTRKSSFGLEFGDSSPTWCAFPGG